ncbi:hypothetical protein CJ483_09050 [Bacillus sp. PK3_68]|nr:hypothetical protein CJ483_09050 [Bacillus sp. PK3_68]
MFFEISECNCQLQSGVAPFDHSLLILLKKLLDEQKETLDKLLPQLGSEEIELEKVKEFISIVYHDHEVASPIFHSWKRANKWMKLPSEEEAERLTPVMEKMKRHLEEAAMELEKIYGSENIKYVIPSFYIPIIR